MLEKNQELFKKQYPDLNFIKYAYVNFKSIEAKDKVIQLFRDTKLFGLNCSVFKDGINHDQELKLNEHTLDV